MTTNRLFFTFTKMIKFIKIYLVFLALVLSIFASHAQKEANVWYFNHRNGLDFNTGEPVLLDGNPMNTAEANICDTLGNFLFVTNSRTVWNRKKEIMQNGTGLNGSIGSSQNSIIVQKPGSDHLYYIFTTPYYQDTPGFYYSIVDMEKVWGFGEVIEKNIFLEAAWDALEMVTAVKHEKKNLMPMQHFY